MFLGVVLLLVAGYLLGERLLAQRLVGVVGLLLDNGCAVSDVRLEVPFQVVLADVRCIPPPPAARVYAPRMVAVPRFGLWRQGTVHIQSLVIEEPRLVLEASTDTSFSSWLPTILPTASSSAADAPPAREAADARWKVIIDHVRIRRGRLEFIDLRVKPAVRVVAEPLFGAIGPWTNEPNAPHAMSMAAECQITAEGHPPTTLRCSGWMDREARGLGLQCGLEGLRLAVLEPYYQGTTQLAPTIPRSTRGLRRRRRAMCSMATCRWR